MNKLSNLLLAESAEIPTDLNEINFKKGLRSAALGLGLAAGSMGANAHAADKPQEITQKSDGKFHFGNEKDPKDNNNKFKYGNQKDPKDNDNKFQFGNNLDPKEASELKSIHADIEEMKVHYKGNPMYQFFKQGAKAVSDNGGDPAAIQSAHQALMKELGAKHMSSQVPLKAFNDGLKFGKLLLRQAQLTPEK